MDTSLPRDRDVLLAVPAAAVVLPGAPAQEVEPKDPGTARGTPAREPSPQPEREPPAREAKVRSGVTGRLMLLGKQAAAVTAVLTALTGLVGAAWGVWQVAEAKRAERKAEEVKQKVEQLKQLTSFGTFAEFVRKYRSIALETDLYMSTLRGRDLFSQCRLEDLLREYQTGSAIYYSHSFTAFREIHEFYDELGLQVKQDALDFSLIFELVTFPSDFAGETAQLCQFVGQHWFGRDRPIAGMCANTDYLWKRYCDARRASAAGSAPSNDFVPSECHVSTAPAAPSRWTATGPRAAPRAHRPRGHRLPAAVAPDRRQR